MGGAAGRARAAARRRPALRSRDHAGRRLSRQARPKSPSTSPPSAAPATARAPRPAPAREPATPAAGMGKVRAQQGFFVVERTCPTCHGAGEVIADPCHGLPRRRPGRQAQDAVASTFPPGVDEGTRIRLSGEGECGPRGAPCGDLYIFLHVARHAIFEREGTTLFARCPISFTTAALGGAIEVPGLDGSRTRSASRPASSRASSCASAAPACRC